ncbi:restriction endonuclease subunit S, partial [Lactiplantibacillus plantarum]
FDKTDNLIAANEQVPKLVIKIVKNFLANSLHLN